jgi:hypothetical protein
MSGDDFCAAMQYGEAVKHKGIALASRAKAFENQVEVPGELEWVFCRAKFKK